MQNIGANVEGNKRVALDTGILVEENTKSPYGAYGVAGYIPQKYHKIVECIPQCFSRLERFHI